MLVWPWVIHRIRHQIAFVYADHLAVAIAPSNPPIPTFNRRDHDDTEARFANIISGSRVSSSGQSGTSPIQAKPVPVLTTLLLQLIDIETLSITRSLRPVASIPLTALAVQEAARSAKVYRASYSDYGGFRSRLRWDRDIESPGDSYHSETDASNQPQEVALAFHSVPYDVSSPTLGSPVREKPRGNVQGDSRARRRHADALMAVTNHGRVLVWDTGDAEVRFEPHIIVEVQDTRSLDVMVRLCHSNDFGSLQFCSQFAIRVLALLFAFQLVTTDH
jgi:hypothetical protein